jgi:hypothetical protein
MTTNDYDTLVLLVAAMEASFANSQERLKSRREEAETTTEEELEALARSA